MTITINSQAISITPNLHTALLKLRHRQSKRMLWIDALCINQTDVDEKQQQVALMGEIYSRTERCLLWLGDEPEYPESTVSKEQEAEVAKLLSQTDDLLKSLAPILNQSSDDLTPELAKALKGEWEE